MNKDLMIYIIISILTFILINGVLFIFFKDRLKPSQVTEQTPADSLKQQTEKIKTDSLSTQKQPEKQLNEYQKLIKLKKKLMEAYTGERTYTPEELNDLLKSTISQIDSISTELKTTQKKTTQLEKQIESSNQTIETKNNKIKNLEEKISEVEQSYEEKISNMNKTQNEEAIDYLAKTYDTMDAKQVARLMQTLPNPKVIAIMKKMNQRKLGKVLENLPTSKSSEILKKMTGVKNE